MKNISMAAAVMAALILVMTSSLGASPAYAEETSVAYTFTGAYVSTASSTHIDFVLRLKDDGTLSVSPSVVYINGENDGPASGTWTEEGNTLKMTITNPDGSFVNEYEVAKTGDFYPFDMYVSLSTFKRPIAMTDDPNADTAAAAQQPEAAPAKGPATFPKNALVLPFCPDISEKLSADFYVESSVWGRAFVASGNYSPNDTAAVLFSFVNDTSENYHLTFYSNGTYTYEFTTAGLTENGTWAWQGWKLTATTPEGKVYTGKVNKEEAPLTKIPEKHTDEFGFEMYLTPDAELEPVAAEQGGAIETVTYRAEVYSVEEKEGLESGSLFEEKKLYVYLPADYDESRTYDVLYLLHGSNETVDYWFYSDNQVSPFYKTIHDIKDSVYTMNHTKDMLDHLFAEGICKDMIVVTPTYFSSLREENAYGDSWDDTMFWLDAFEKELRQDIIPLIESKYPTYTEAVDTAEGIQASREHRAIAGFSRGSRFITRVAMQKMEDVFGWFGCFHGNQDLTPDLLRAALEKTPDCPVYYWYNGTGVQDPTPSVTEQRNLCKTVTDSLSDLFSEGVNFVLVDKPMATHNYDVALTDLYNFCHVVFHQVK